MDENIETIYDCYTDYLIDNHLIQSEKLLIKDSIKYVIDNLNNTNITDDVDFKNYLNKYIRDYSELNQLYIKDIVLLEDFYKEVF